VTPAVGRAAAGMGLAAALSRAVGAVRVLVVAAVLGTSYLGNAFQGSNQFSTVLFELLAAGALSAVLVPSFVSFLDRGDQRGAEAAAGGVLGIALVVLGALTLVGMAGAPWLARLLTVGVEDRAVAADQAALTTQLLRWFLPQLLLYGWGAVAIAVLHARRSFVVPALAPIGNTVVMVALLLAFSRAAGPDPGLILRPVEVLLLAAAGTLGVAAFVAVPVVVLVRSGFRLRPRFAWRDPAVRRLLGLGSWATVQHASAALLLGAALVVGGAVEGGVVAFQVGWFFFLAPYGIIAQPIQTAVLPEVVGELEGTDRTAVSRSLGWSMETMSALLWPVSGAFVALATPIAGAIAFGAARSGDGVSLIAAAVAALGLGLFAYGAYLLLARTFYALGDSRTPAAVGFVAAVAGVALMAAWGAAADGAALVWGLGVAHGLSFGAAALVLASVLRRRYGIGVWSAPTLWPVAVSTVLAVPVWLAVRAWQPTGRPAEVVAVAAGGVLIVGLGALAGRRLGVLRERPVAVHGAMP
jgi:putative peptidoglycan lipid II flippase